MDYQTGHVMTLANSIIGVSVLAMPYCFKQCGIILSIVMLLISSIMSRLACHFLIKSAIIARRKTFEYLAYYIFGSLGKFIIEIGIAGFLIGTCIAFFVVIGDLTPEIISEMTGHPTTSTLRSSLLMAMALFCVLPLGLLRNIDSLSGVSKITIGFYFCLVMKIIIEAIPHFFSGDWYDDVRLWRPAGITQCLPIFAMALSCQTQLFEIYKVLHNPSLEKMNSLVRIAVTICTIVYILVGVFGYIAFAKKTFAGNILTTMEPSPTAYVMKIGFVLSVVFSFPLVIFPSRVSLHSLLYKEGYSIHEGASSYIPEGKFKGLTMFIVFISLIIGIMIPNIELVLGLVGSTIGVLICVVFPVMSFIYISQKNTNERLLAQFILIIGITIMILGTYENLRGFDRIDTLSLEIESSKQNLQDPDIDHKLAKRKPIQPIQDKIITERSSLKMTEEFDVRHEPPQPIEPQESSDNKGNSLQKDVKPLIIQKKRAPLPVEKQFGKIQDETRNIDSNKPSNKPVEIINKEEKTSNNTIGIKISEQVDIEAIKKDEREAAEAEKDNAVVQVTKKKASGDIHIKNKHQYMKAPIEKHNELPKESAEQHNKLIDTLNQHNQKHIDLENEQKLEVLKRIESIAHKAIEDIIAGKDNNKVAANIENNVGKTNTPDDIIVEVHQEISNNKEIQNTKKKEILKDHMGQKNNRDQMQNKAQPNNTYVNNKSDNKLPQMIISNKTGPYLLNLRKGGTNSTFENKNDQMVLLPPAVNPLKKSEDKKPIVNEKTEESKLPKVNVIDTEKSDKMNNNDNVPFRTNETKILRDILSHTATER